jgi:hypothetical protein
MVQLLDAAHPAAITGATPLTEPATRMRLSLELRLVAEDLAGRVDRDELSLDEELRLAEALDAAVEAVLPQILNALDEALTPRMEALPLRARLTLARARGRHELGFE